MFITVAAVRAFGFPQKLKENLLPRIEVPKPSVEFVTFSDVEKLREVMLSSLEQRALHAFQRDSHTNLVQTIQSSLEDVQPAEQEAPESETEEPAEPARPKRAEKIPETPRIKVIMKEKPQQPALKKRKVIDLTKDEDLDEFFQEIKFPKLRTEPRSKQKRICGCCSGSLEEGQGFFRCFLCRVECHMQQNCFQKCASVLASSSSEHCIHCKDQDSSKVGFTCIRCRHFTCIDCVRDLVKTLNAGK